ncbi:MAG: aminoacyl-histidine dipeptidase [Cyanobacteria bacterium SIG32]|nr:aminoacyl-histidine dipeptidase [Cyanobacteria bacterium SIG32]
MDIKALRNENELVDLFCSLAEIPSPSLHEEAVVDWIVQYCAKNNLKCETDDYGNVHVEVQATDSTKSPILLSAHMDVVGDDSPVKVYLDGDFIKAEGRTLGADDKAGVANALYFVNRLSKSNIAHGGVEVVFTRDEESGMTGIRHVDFSKLKSKYVLVLDSDSLGQLLTAGASYTQVTLEMNTFKGGHSGIDIADETRENAAKLLADLVSELPQGVFYAENGQVVTSCNIGGLSAGKLEVTNVINTYGQATYSIRSSSRAKEEELKDLMKFLVEEFNKEYKDMAEAKIIFKEHMPAFEKNEDDYIPILFEAVAKKVGITPEISSFHAGAETHIYANEKNAQGEKFAPYLVGLATVCNMHSDKEYVDYKTMIEGQKLLQALFEAYNC